MVGKYATLAGEALSPEQEEAWRTIQALADRFLKADLLRFAVPL
jgi:FMN-dependent NADH-azoreductase